MSKISKASGWLFNKAIGRKPQFDLRHFERDWIVLGNDLHNNFNTLGVKLGVVEQFETKINPPEEIEIDKEPNVIVSTISNAASTVKDVAGSVMETAVDGSKMTANATKTVVVVAGGAAVAVGSKAVGVVKTGLFSSLRLTGKLAGKMRRKLEQIRDDGKEIETEVNPIEHTELPTDQEAIETPSDTTEE